MPKAAMLKTGLLLIVLALSASTPALADDPRPVDVPAGDLIAALQLLEKQSGVEVVYRPELLKGLHTDGVKGVLLPEEAVTRLLKGTNLRIHGDKTGVLLITEASPDRAAAPSSQKIVPRGVPVPRAPGETTGSRGTATDEESPALEEIVVTAQKRAERLQDTPVPVTVLDTTELVARNQIRLQDYFVQVPGLSLNAAGDGTTTIVIRGIATALYSNPTVAVTIDDVPFGGSTALANGQLVQPDLDPGDLAQIEVLRGPQGTLYGASSLGGLIKYVTADPSTSGYSGRLEADLNGIRGGGDVGYGVRGYFNAPIGDTLALRASGFSRLTPGYIDDVYTGRTDINSISVAGGHLSLLWTPSALLAVKIGALYQYTHAGAGSAINTNSNYQPLYGDLHESFLPDSGAYWNESTLYTAKIDVHLGWSDLTSVTGYGSNFYKESADTTLTFGAPPYSLAASELFNRFDTQKITQELRLASPTGNRVDWLVGGFYTHEHSPAEQDINGVDPTTGVTLGTPLAAIFPTTYEEFAVFGDATYHFTQAFNLQGGVRYSRSHQTYTEADYGSLGETAPGVPFTSAQDSADHSVTFLVVPQLTINPDMMAYVRVASGYRPGGPNADAALVHLPGTFKADTTLNYEIGLKGNALHGAFTYDLSAFYIDWHSIQLQVKDPVSGFSFFSNGGAARSTGLEAALKYRNGTGLRIAANASYDVAELSQDAPPGTYAASGDRLPYSPRLSGSLSTDQDFRLSGEWTGFIGGTVSYLGTRLGAFQGNATQLRLVFPSYTTLDLRVGTRSGPWTANLFARNVTDDRGVLSSRTLEGVQLPTSIYITNFIQPRTLGLSVARSF
ncbi:TonB-dependent receptor [Caballeronia mineralivorans]|uniref:TonB-dependent receptor domain-containing protein n=1 Tax=Caballeronia mineralivorans TaxID=2010198 RepID=UPI0023F40370|nr:TonB-dependent receptor [Caballeronia mineralivorans]MDB5782045.1 TonB-dependent receptor, plug [Caballeronia mineralivorans]